MICTTNLELANRTAELTRQQRRSQCQATDSMFGLLMLFQWVAAVWAACYVTPKAWVGEAVFLPHQHLWTAVIWGATISGIPLLLTIKYPGAATTRHVVAISQMLFSGLLIYLTGGRPETHFHVFGSLAFLAFYRDWRVLVTASLVITADHFFSGIYSTQSILESGGDGAFRCLEYSGWIVFENVFLVISCRREIRETWKSCERQARLENANQTMEAKVAARTDQLLKKTEEAEQLALVAQYTDNAVVITNALAQIQWVNEGFIRTSGYSLDEVRGKSPGSFLQGPNTDINTIQYMRQQLSRGQGFEVEIVNYNKQQQPYWVVIECRPIYNEHGDVTRFIAIESDITDRKKREEQLRLYSKAFTEANDAIIISEVPAGGGMAKILSVNAAFERMTGYTNAEVVGRNPRMLQGAGTDPDARARIRDSLKRWAPVREEMLNYKKNGEEFWVELNIAPLANEAGQLTHWVSVQRNITERKQLERNVVERTLELENAKEKAETANKLKSEFLANMSHEIRTPLNGVMGMLELLIGTELTDKQRGYAEISHNSANTLLALINDILDYSKIEAEQLTLESTPFNLRKMAEEITAIAATQVAVRSVEVILDYPSSTPSGVVGDPLRLRQVITNLLGNAIKFTESGYIVVEINAVLTEQKEHCFRIAVRDTGVGIP